MIVWQEAHRLCLSVYQATKSFPSDERFGLISQMQRSSYSVPTNIAEGNGKKSWKEKAHFYETAHCSLEELSYQCMLARDLKYLSGETSETLDDHTQRVSYLLTRLRSSLPT